MIGPLQSRGLKIQQSRGLKIQQSRGLKIQQSQVRASLCGVDPEEGTMIRWMAPVHRRKYCVSGLNNLSGNILLQNIQSNGVK